MHVKPRLLLERKSPGSQSEAVCDYDMHVSAEKWMAHVYQSTNICGHSRRRCRSYEADQANAVHEQFHSLKNGRLQEAQATDSM